ncbi:MAG: adenylate kinase [Bacteroidota bacterium]|nr:adenylate kinase [Bacteroidota bacterium]
MFNIVLFGAPGSGKGTQAIKLKEKYDLVHLSTGDAFREEISHKTPLGLEAKNYMDQGNLVPDDLVIRIVIHAMEKHSKAKGVIFDGFPRTLDQAAKLDAILSEKGKGINSVIALDCHKDLLVQRLVKRGIDSGRSDDTEDVINKRLIVYNEQTAPLIEYYKKQSKFINVDGNGSIDEVFEKVAKLIDNKICYN